MRVYSLPATRLAEELGKRMVMNIVMVGFFGAVTNLLNPDALRQAVADSVPEAFRELNLKAFDKGFEYGTKHLSGGGRERRRADRSLSTGTLGGFRVAVSSKGRW